MRSPRYTDDGHRVTALHVERGTIAGRTVDGDPIVLAFTPAHVDPDRGHLVDEHFSGTVGRHPLGGVGRPTARRGHPLTQRDLCAALDAAVAYAEDLHPARWHDDAPHADPFDRGVAAGG